MNGELLVIKHLGVDMIFKKKRRVTDIIKLKLKSTFGCLDCALKK